MGIIEDDVFEYSMFIAWQIEANEGFVYIVNLKTNQWYYLDGIAMEIWQHIDKHSVSEIVEKLVEKYQENYKLIYDDVIEFLETICQEEHLVAKISNLH